MRKLTTQDFIQQATLIHGSKYDYTLTVYQKSNEPVIITCPIHGEFHQRPNDHTSKKQGCPRCGKESQAASRRKDSVDFIAQARALHGNAYDYSKVVYINTHTHVTITCPTHGDFSQKPNTHLSKVSGCPECAREQNPGRYMEHRFGSTIPVDTPGVFYVVRFSNSSETFIKIGITSLSAKRRHSGKHKGYTMVILCEQQMTLHHALLKETTLKHILRDYRYTPSALKEGHTECFTEAALPLIGL